MRFARDVSTRIFYMDQGEIDLALRYSEKSGLISLEMLMPAGIDSVLHNPAFAPDELSMSIIEGLCDKIEEVVEEHPDGGSRLRLSFEIKRVEN